MPQTYADTKTWAARCSTDPRPGDPPCGLPGLEVLTGVRRRNRTYLPDLEVSRRRQDEVDPVPAPPDIAIEVLSPDDRASRVLDRVDFYLAEGVQIVWVVDPETVTEYRQDGRMRIHRKETTLDGSPILEGFSLHLVELFAGSG